jgi:hypothetical protein
MVDNDVYGNGFTVGDIFVEKKRGWDYLWVSYKQKVDNNTLIQVAEQVNIEQVYYEGDFEDFDI